jgi:ABC-type glycerol-3-phosphate transport system substrate-binding protein
MRMTKSMRRRVAAAVLALAMAPALVSCGGDESAPSEQVPALGKHLEKVDEAVGSGDYAQARAAVKELVAEAARAQVDGELSDEQAQRIVTAARSVLENLPD